MAEFGKGSELLELESVQRAIAESSQWLGQERARMQSGWSRYFVSNTRHPGGGPMESPIEAIFSTWFFAVVDVEIPDVWAPGLIPQFEAVINGQKCRFDFRVYLTGEVAAKGAELGLEQPRIAVELDGHDFHERTKEQVAIRNERDRNAQTEGWTILHFSGSELYRDPLKCVRSVIDVAGRKHEEWFKTVYGK